MARRIERMASAALCRLLQLASLAAGVLLASPAAANGRFPAASQLVEDPSDPQKLLLRTTFGLLLSRDAGKSWHWVCEQAAGFRDNQDPPVDITGSGALLVGTFEGLKISRDFGCDWKLAPEVQDQFVKDVSVFPKDPSKAVLIVSSAAGGGAYTNRVYKSEDSAATWTQLGPDLPSELILHTLDVAASNPSHIYVTAQVYVADETPDTGRLLQLSAAGDAWEAVPILGLGTPYLSGIDPNDEKLVYIRMDRTVESDRLLVSRDAGASFIEALSLPATGGMLGFALSPDGSTVLLGHDPNGIYRAPSTTLVFESMSESRNQCLTWNPNALYACSTYFVDGSFVESGFLLGRSSDNGSSFNPLWRRLFDVLGPMQCDPQTIAARACTSRWPDLYCETLGGCRDAGSDAAPPKAAASGGDSKSCGCRFVAPDRATLLPLFLLLSFLARARRAKKV